MQLNRLKHAEKEKESLEGDRQKADEFLRLDAKIRTQQNVLYQTHIANARENVDKVREPFFFFFVCYFSCFRGNS